MAGTTEGAAGTTWGGRPSVAVAGELGWSTGRGCAGFPPSRERGGRVQREGRGNDAGRSRERRGAGDQGFRIVPDLGGPRVAVALGSRLRGNDEGRCGNDGSGRGNDAGRSRERRGAGDQGFRVVPDLGGPRLVVALGSRLRGDDMRSRAGQSLGSRPDRRPHGMSVLSSPTDHPNPVIVAAGNVDGAVRGYLRTVRAVQSSLGLGAAIAAASSAPFTHLYLRVRPLLPRRSRGPYRRSRAPYRHSRVGGNPAQPSSAYRVRS